MTVESDVLGAANREIGYTEWPPESNLSKFGSWFGANGQPWCAQFVSYCFYVVGLPLSAESKKGFAFCPNGVKWFKEQSRFFNTPKVGDVAFFDWHKGRPACRSNKEENCSDAWHVGIVESVNADGSIITIEGNTEIGNDGNGGKAMRRKRYPDVWYGFGRPDYSGAPNTEQEDHPQWPGRYIMLTSPFASGNDVRLWKSQMIARGWDLGSSPIDVFDRRSDEVLHKFQADNGLEIDAKIGPVSWNSAWELPVA